jgi:hypothetical protein
MRAQRCLLFIGISESNTPTQPCTDVVLSHHLFLLEGKRRALANLDQGGRANFR